MVVAFYFIVLIFALMMLARVLLGNKKVDSILVVSVLLITINSAGRFMLSVSGDLEVAILANKILYVGACYIPFVFVLLMSNLSGFKLHKSVIAILCAYSTVIMVSVMTIGKSPLYYKSVELGYSDGYYYLIKEYGPMHALYTFMTIIFGAVMLFFCIYAVKHRNKLSTVTVVIMSAIGFSVIIFYFFERILGLSVSILSVGYLIGLALAIKHFEQLNMYDMSANVFNSIECMNRYGYIAFNSKYKYIASNSLARELFSDIKSWEIDKEVTPDDSVLYNDIVKPLMEWDGKTDITKIVAINDGYYEMKLKHITNGKKKDTGYLLEFEDRTLEQKYYNAMEEFNSKMKHEVEEKTKEIQLQKDKQEELFMQTVMALSEAVDAKDRYTSGHSNRVAQYAKMIAARMGKSEEEQEHIYRAGLLHDVGKIRIPAEIINKPGKLTDEEYNIIKIHPITGYHILRGISGDSDIAVAAKYHHERYDGKGYPNGLAGDRIPEIARILGVADSYDAMASNRSYRKALPQQVIKDEIEKGKGTQFDPEIADIMFRMIDEDKDYNMKEKDSDIKKILIVDDEQMNHMMISFIMKDEPMYELTSAMDGYEALKLLEENQYDLILLDVMMPGIDGIETLRQIREKCDIPVVIMTSDKSMELATAFEELGCDDFITKPFLPLLIKEIIYNMSKRNRE